MPIDTDALLRKGSHPAFTPPADVETKIWRYMDMTQFVSMLEERSLLFTRADLLQDRFEGTMSLPLYNFLQQIDGDPEQHAGLLRLTKGWSFVNCWHINDYESAAMWKIYSSANESVCIQTTFARLREAFDSDVRIGMINYISYDRDKIPANNTFWPLMYKRRSFEHERELRAVWSKLNMVSEEGPAVASGYEYRPAPEECIWKGVDLKALVENIFVSPATKPWFRRLVELILSRYDLDISVRSSDLDANPLM